VDLKSAVVTNKAQFPELIHEKIDPDRVVPTISANISCEILGCTC